MWASSNRAVAYTKNSQLTLRVWWPPESSPLRKSSHHHFCSTENEDVNSLQLEMAWASTQKTWKNAQELFKLRKHFARPRWKLRYWHILAAQDLIRMLRKQPPNRIKRIKYIGTNYPGICKTCMWKSGRHGWKKWKAWLLRKTGNVLRARAWCC